MADAAIQKTNGFACVFSEFKRGMCFFHVKQALEKKILALNDYELQIDILTDMADIQRSQNKSIFDPAIEFFVNKYMNKKNAHIKVFWDYFLEYWYEKNPGLVSAN
jgi:hypothetical protein